MIAEFVYLEKYNSFYDEEENPYEYDSYQDYNYRNNEDTVEEDF
jgi:hypothetical protein